MGSIPPTAQVFKVQWWMCHYTAPTPKPHYGFSNSPRISRLNRGALRGWVRKDESQGGVRTAELYYNSEGKQCYKGTKALRKTEPLDYTIKLCMNCFLYRMCKCKWNGWWKKTFTTQGVYWNKLPFRVYIYIYLSGAEFFPSTICLFKPRFLQHPHHQLREYPVRFGFALVDIYDELVSTARGVPLPAIVPPAIDSFLAMADAPDRLDTAGVHEAFNYLRKGKHLEIPDRWRPYIPKQL